MFLKVFKKRNFKFLESFVLFLKVCFSVTGLGICLLSPYAPCLINLYAVCINGPSWWPAPGLASPLLSLLL